MVVFSGCTVADVQTFDRRGTETKQIDRMGVRQTHIVYVLKIGSNSVGRKMASRLPCCLSFIEGFTQRKEVPTLAVLHAVHVSQAVKMSKIRLHLVCARDP